MTARRVLLLCGSPRPSGSNSAALLNGLRDRLDGRAETTLCRAADVLKESRGPSAAEVLAFDAAVLAFPLYVDGVPASLYDPLEAIGRAAANDPEAARTLRFHAIANNGFYEARQNAVALDMLGSWCDACGIARGRSLALGAGEMAQAAPIGRGPLTSLGKALDRLADDVAEGRPGEPLFVEPDFPRALYQLAGHAQWKCQAKANGLKPKELLRLS